MNRILVCLLLFTAFLHADEFDPKDNTIVLGQRVGLTKPDMSAPNIEPADGKQNFKVQKIPGAEGEQIDAAKLIAGKDREFEIVWDLDNDKKQGVCDIGVVGTAW